MQDAHIGLYDIVLSTTLESNKSDESMHQPLLAAVHSDCPFGHVVDVHFTSRCAMQRPASEGERYVTHSWALPMLSQRPDPEASQDQSAHLQHDPIAFIAMRFDALPALYLQSTCSLYSVS